MKWAFTILGFATSVTAPLVTACTRKVDNSTPPVLTQVPDAQTESDGDTSTPDHEADSSLQSPFAIPKPSEVPFISNDSYPECVHPGVTPVCSDGWCRVPSGCFIFGSPPDELGRSRFDEQQVAIALSHDFLIQQTEVTQGDWQEAGLSISNYPWPESGTFCDQADCPINGVTWFEALKYANWMSEQEDFQPCFHIEDCTEAPRDGSFGENCSVTLLSSSVYSCEGYRLPTTAEWEYAARAGSFSTFYSGGMSSFDDDYLCNLDQNLASVAWYCANTPNAIEQSVKQLLPNAWGLYDILGNVDEWVMDRDTGLPLANPGVTTVDPGNILDTREGAIRRGCRINSPHILCRVAATLGSSRNFRDGGVRLVRTLGPGTLPTLNDVPNSEPLDASQ